MTRRLIVLGLLSLACMGNTCDSVTSHLEPDPETIPNSAVISVNSTLDPQDSTGSQLVATVQALIPAGATSRNVTFTASSGAFIENASKTITVRAEPDSADTTHLVAVARLRDTITENVMVRGAIADRYEVITVAFIKRP
jgi:hypothetical protein